MGADPGPVMSLAGGTVAHGGHKRRRTRSPRPAAADSSGGGGRASSRRAWMADRRGHRPTGVASRIVGVGEAVRTARAHVHQSRVRVLDAAPTAAQPAEAGADMLTHVRRRTPLQPRRPLPRRRLSLPCGRPPRRRGAHDVRHEGAPRLSAPATPCRARRQVAPKGMPSHANRPRIHKARRDRLHAMTPAPAIAGMPRRALIEAAAQACLLMSSGA